MTTPLTRGLRAGGALAVLLAVIVGVPTLLGSLRLVPHGLPRVDQIVTALQSRDDGQLAEIVLAAGVWVCWALFTASTAAEIVALARSRPARRLPGLRVFQRPAAALVTAVAVGFTLGPTAIGAAASSPAPPPLPVAAAGSPLAAAQPFAAASVLHGDPTVNPLAHDPPQETPSQETPSQAAAKAYVVQRRDTLWALAERYLGDPLRYPEIIGLNPTAVGPDNEILPGTVLTMPPDATGLPPTVAGSGSASGTPAQGEDVTVRPGDTLWGLTEQITGHGENWPQAWTANRGRREPGGARFTDPALIRPGWTLTIPNPAGAQAPPAPPAPPSDPPSGPEPTPPSTPSIPSSPATTAPTSPDTAEPSPTAPAPPPAPSSGPRETPAVPSPPAAQPPPPAAADLPMVAFTGGGLLLAGLSLTALLRYRRRQFRHRRPGRTISSTPAGLVGVERALYTAGGAGIADVTWLDRALRSLAQTLAAVDGARLPDVLAACLTDDVLTLVLAEPSPDAPRPWTADAAGTRWSIRRGDPLPYDERRRPYTFGPYPTLASIGCTADGEHWLLDLERAGALSLSGNPDRCLDLARFLAAELAHNTWSEMLQVTLVGFGAELAGINPDRLTFTDDADRAVRELAAQLTSVTDAMRAADVDVLSGRLHDIAADTWAPHVVLVAAHAARDHAGLRRLLATINEQPGRSAVALVLIDDADNDYSAGAAGWQLTLDDAGILRIPTLGLELTAHGVPAGEAAQLAQLLAAAAVTDDRPVPPAHGDKPWDAYADACGGLRLHHEAGPPAPRRATAPQADLPTSRPAAASPQSAGASPRSAGASPQALDSLLPMPPQTYLDRAATTEQDLRALAPATDNGTRRRVEAADPTLDTDLADWADHCCPRPKLTLLGRVGVRARGSLPERNPRRAFYTEIVAYLATRPTGATGEQYATAIWSDEPDVAGKTKVRQSISVVRGWLGTDPATGQDYLPAADSADRGGRYRIDRILIDAELFRRLRVRGQARGADGIADLRTALDLVTGKPFDGIPAPRRGAPGGYRWLIEDNSRLDHEYAAMIVDVAHTVATHHLAAGEPGLAADAARVALRAGSFEDVPLLDLVAACDAQGHRAEADAYVARILTNHDAEVEEDLPPRTAEILFRRQFGDSPS